MACGRVVVRYVGEWSRRLGELCLWLIILIHVFWGMISEPCELKHRQQKTRQVEGEDGKEVG